MNSGAMEHAADESLHQPKADPVPSQAGKSMLPPASAAAMPPPAGKAVGVMPPTRKNNVADADPEGNAALRGAPQLRKA